MSPLPDHIEQALLEGESNASDVLPRAEVNRLLEPGYLPLETGYTTLPDGTAHVAVLTQFPGTTGEMIDWWFGFWLGEAHVRALPERNPIDRLLETRLVRKLMIPDRLGRDLLIHCAEEMNHLASFLPALFAQETGSASALGRR